MKDSTMQIIGEENFLKTCRKFSLDEKEIEILKKILKKWDELPPPPRTEEEDVQKLRSGAEGLVKISPERRDKFLSALFEVSRLFAILGRRRH